MKNDLLLMSIKTKYANLIFEGTKKFEYRRKSIGEKNCNKRIYIYSSEEEKSIIGYIIVDKILSGNIKEIQELTDNYDSVMEEYFNDCETCYALHIGEYHKLAQPIKLSKIKSIDKLFVIPQYYRYIKKDESIYSLLVRKNDTL